VEVRLSDLPIECSKVLLSCRHRNLAGSPFFHRRSMASDDPSEQGLPRLQHFAAMSEQCFHVGHETSRSKHFDAPAEHYQKESNALRNVLTIRLIVSSQPACSPAS